MRHDSVQASPDVDNKFYLAAWEAGALLIKLILLR